MTTCSILSHLFPDSELHPRSVEDVLAQSSFLEKMRGYEAACGQTLDSMSFEQQEALIQLRLQQLVNTLKINPLWQERFRQHGISEAPLNFDQWQQVPLTDRETLHDFYMGTRPGQVVPLSCGGFEVVASGGTSGGLPIETVYSLRELRDTYLLSGTFMDRYLFQPHFPKGFPNWVIMTLSDYDMWSSGTMIGGVLQRAPSMNFIAAGPMGEKVYEHILSFDGPKAIMGMSREIEKLVELGANVPQEHRNSFRLAIYGSGLMQARRVAELKTMYPQLQIVSYFASNQAEAIGIQLQPGAMFTAVPGLHFIEIVDDQGRWVNEGEEGELVITRLHASEAPVLRMKLGDRMILRAPRLSSQLNAMQMEFAGRSSDVVHIGETHYAARRVLDLLLAGLAERGFPIGEQATEIQFLNDRVSQKLTLLASAEQADAIHSCLHQTLDEPTIRTLFTGALRNSMPLYDQNERRCAAIDQTIYRFDVRIVHGQSDAIYRTKVNKVPLIRDIV
jgi:phenylacetate-CoA ligase